MTFTISSSPHNSSSSENLPITAHTSSPRLSSHTFNFKIDSNSDTGQRLVESVQIVREKAATGEVLDPIQGKDITSNVKEYPPLPNYLLWTK